MSTWTEEDKAKIVQMYKDKKPTPDTSVEIIKEIAEELEKSPNAIRMILIQAGAHVKKGDSAAAGSKPAAKSASAGGEGSKRVSKESQIAELRTAIEARGKTVDDDILSKLTGKAAAYLVSVLKAD